MSAWTQYGLRLDIALAVVMEVAVLRLHRAETAAEQAEAVSFNHDLWRVASSLAPSAPVAEDRDALSVAAHLVAAGGKTAEQLMEINRRFARLLAGRAATDGALGHILDRWRAARHSGADMEFGPWLLGLLTGFPADDRALAA
ncbi:MAG: hypothetical protein NVV74_11305 [Magnetospirillum sp.]|nr:hypothetical protein [Magnetospirillum sp.]